MSNVEIFCTIVIIVSIIITIYNVYIYLDTKRIVNNMSKKHEKIVNDIFYPVLFNNKQDKYAELKNWLIYEGWEFEQVNNRYGNLGISHVFKKNGFTITDNLFRHEFCNFIISNDNPYFIKDICISEIHQIHDALSLTKQQMIINNFMKVYTNE